MYYASKTACIHGVAFAYQPLALGGCKQVHAGALARSCDSGRGVDSATQPHVRLPPAGPTSPHSPALNSEAHSLLARSRPVQSASLLARNANSPGQCEPTTVTSFLGHPRPGLAAASPASPAPRGEEDGGGGNPGPGADWPLRCRRRPCCC